MMTTDWKPRPWLAGPLNLWGGLGHLYAGRLLVALAIPPLLLVWLFGLLLASCYVSTARARVAIAVVFLISRLIAVPMWGYLAARQTQPAIIKRRMWIVWSADANGPRFDRIGQTVR